MLADFCKHRFLLSLSPAIPTQCGGVHKMKVTTQPVPFCPFRACWAYLIASVLYLSLRPVTVGSGRIGLFQPYRSNFFLSISLFFPYYPITDGSLSAIVINTNLKQTLAIGRIWN